MRRLSRLLGGLTGLFLLTGMGGHVPVHLNLTDSLPWGFYRETHEPIIRGALVAECLPPALAALGKQRGWLWHGSCPTGTPPILKRVAAVAGDEVRLTDDFVAVNGTILLNTKSLFLDSQGREIPRVARGTFTLQAGQVFLLGENKNSWDSRYIGAVEVKNILCTARPVWTFTE